MNLTLLVENLTNPALLFFLLGILAVRLKSDLEIPPSSSKFISLYLLFSIFGYIYINFYLDLLQELFHKELL